MTNIAKEAKKKKSYFVVEQEGKIIKESYVNTDRESFHHCLVNIPDPVLRWKQAAR